MHLFVVLLYAYLGFYVLGCNYVYFCSYQPIGWEGWVLCTSQEIGSEDWLRLAESETWRKRKSWLTCICHHTKFGEDILKGGWVMTINVFSKWRPVKFEGISLSRTSVFSLKQNLYKCVQQWLELWSLKWIYKMAAVTILDFVNQFLGPPAVANWCSEVCRHVSCWSDLLCWRHRNFNFSYFRLEIASPCPLLGCFGGFRHHEQSFLSSKPPKRHILEWNHVVWGTYCGNPSWKSRGIEK